MITPYDHVALWNKAKVFLNRAMDDEAGRSFDEQALWASAALELLAKAALAKVTPVLIAEPNEDGRNILIATGLIEGEARFASVAAKTIFTRCARAFHPFNYDEAMRIANARNEYLHGATLGFLLLPPDVWWARYWALAAILVDAVSEDLDGLVGTSRVRRVEALLEQNAKYVEERTQSLIGRAQQRLALFKAGSLSAHAEREWRSRSDLTAGLKYRQDESCPACGGTGQIEGEEDTDLQYEYDYDDEGMVTGVWATVQVPSDYFSCPTCHLVLDSYEFVVQAGLPETFEAVDEDPEPEQEYGND